jgi:low affinity Fe/Cu permease
MAKKVKRLHFKIDEKLATRFKEHVDLVGYDQGKLVEKILKNFLKKMKNNENIDK